MNKEFIADIVEWDIENWSKGIDFWSERLDIQNRKHKCLELGGRRGGLSLWLASHGNEVICSDLESPKEHAAALHEKYPFSYNIDYAAIDATRIPFENEFDLVVFKSILGGISGDGHNELKKKAVDEMHKCLKPNGKLLFAENLESSFLHMAVRKRMVKWGSRWNYLKHEEMKEVFSSFDTLEYQTAGFFGAFGRTERQRRFLSKADRFLIKLLPPKKRYIVFGIAGKGA